MSRIRIVTARAPGLIPSLVREIGQAPHPVVFIPESFTLACETEIVNRSAVAGIFGLKIFSPLLPGPGNPGTGRPRKPEARLRRRPEYDGLPAASS